jgi:YD repeat-containing protein
MAYNAYGNLSCTQDAKGNITNVAYDSSSTFPKAVTNPLSHQTTTQYYGVDGVAADKGLYGQVKSVTDPNGNTTTSEYDTFGRMTLTVRPSDDTSPTNLYGKTYKCYMNFGSPTLQRIITYPLDQSAGLPACGGLPNQKYPWVEEYFDGLGRTYKTRSLGPDGKIIRTDTVFNTRGQLGQTSLPYFDTVETARYRTFTYDPVGRVTQVDNPDGTRTLSCYNDWVSVMIDANNHRKRETRDAYGRLARVDEYQGTTSTCATSVGTPYATTTYQYDVLGNLRFVTDAKSNVTEMRYDTLSRKVYMHDPDMGTWTYEYDANGNLTKQTDAKGQVIDFTYDALNRLKTKTLNIPDTQPPSDPSSLTATAVSGSQINLSWTASTDNVGVDHYEVWRSFNNNPYTLAGSPTTASFADNSASGSTTYLYKVRAVDGTGNFSGYSNVDLATTITFTDDPLTAGTTLVKAQHITELRQAVNAVRASTGLSAAVWTDSSLAGIQIKVVHIQELRSNLNPALTAIGFSTPTYTDATLIAGSTVVKKAHVEELRQPVK